MNEQPPPTSLSVMIIEDDPTLGVTLGERLISSGYSVRLEMGGEEGLAACQESHPDMIILDMIMPGLGGIATLRKLRQDAWGASVPVLALSNLPSSSKEDEVIALGAVSYLLKSDTSLSQIVEVVRKHIGSPL